MTRFPAAVWPLLILGTAQAALAASVLTEAGWAWGLAAAGYPVALVWLARRRGMTGGRLALVAYLLPLAGYAALYTAFTLPARPEMSEAGRLFRPAAGPPPPTRPSALPAPRLVPPRGNGAVARGVWLVASAAVSLAACAVAGLVWHTPAVVYLAAAVAAAVAFRPSEE